MKKTTKPTAKKAVAKKPTKRPHKFRATNGLASGIRMRKVAPRASTSVWNTCDAKPGPAG
jgi:hypothetical protein